MLAEKSQFTEIFPFEAYHRLEKLKLTKRQNKTKKMNMIFAISTPKLPKNSLYLADHKNCVGECNWTSQTTEFSVFAFGNCRICSIVF